jgi:nucleoside-diphosphate-sugar epimerase
MNTICMIGTGWLGLPIARELVERGFRVLGTTTSEARFPELKEYGIHPYIHHLGVTRPPQAPIYVISVPPRQSHSYVQDLMKTYSGMPSKANVLFISTTSVYTGRPDIFPESQVVPGQPTPDDAHRTSKHSAVSIADLILAEGVFWEEKRKRHTILRCGGLVGPGREPGRFLAGRVDVPDPEAPANISPLERVIDDVVSIILLGDWGKVKNAVDRVRPTRREYYTNAALELGLEPPRFMDGEAR